MIFFANKIFTQFCWIFHLVIKVAFYIIRFSDKASKLQMNEPHTTVRVVYEREWLSKRPESSSTK